MLIKARAKINWTLDVVGRREDGYHLLDMLLQSVELYDTLSIQPADTLSLCLEGQARVPDDEDNLALRAAHLLRDTMGVRKGALIRLSKRIPVSAGMGGGSADAAAVLAGLNRLWELRLSEAELCALGLQIGSDVPFCLTGGLQRVQGTGDVMAPQPCKLPFWLVVVQPCRGLSTRDVFGALDARTIAPHARPDNEAALRALAQGNSRALTHAMGNVLQSVAVRMRPEISEAVQALESFGAMRAQMTGSGSAVIGLFDHVRAAQRAWASASRIWRRTFTTRTASRGLVIRNHPWLVR